MRVRRVVTGQTPDGKSVVVSDADVDPIRARLMPGGAIHAIWGADEAVRLPTEGRAPSAPDYFPPAGGFRFELFTVGPGAVSESSEIDMDAAITEFRQKFPGVLERMDPGNPGMHRSDTVDRVLVLSGDVWLELDEGAEVHLEAGACVVQNGTRHAWRNKSSAPCVMAVSIVGAQRTP